MKEDENLMSIRLSLLLGTIIGQLSELLNQISSQTPNMNYVYNSLLDIQKMASLQIHELYYKGNKEEKKNL